MIAHGQNKTRRIGRELLFWFGTILIFLLVTGALTEARVIPTRFMEPTLLIGDHVLIDRIGYDVSFPFSPYHWRLWRKPHRLQMIIFRAPIPGPAQDFIERLIGMPGDLVEIRQGVVYVNDSVLSEPYRRGAPNPTDNYGPIAVPAGNYFVLGDNRSISFDSRNWGFVPDSNVWGTPLLIYLSIEAPEEAWQPGELGTRLRAYWNAIGHPHLIRWNRLFRFV